MPELIRMPEVAADTNSATLVGFPVAVEASFSAHDAIATVETAKAMVDIEADADGVLLATLVPEGAEVEVGAPIALIGAPGERIPDIPAALAALGAGNPNGDAGSDTKTALALDIPEADRDASPPAPSVDAIVPADPVPEPTNSNRVFASPLARRLAREAGLTVSDIPGSGPNSRIVRRDVEAAIARDVETSAHLVNGKGNTSGNSNTNGSARPSDGAVPDAGFVDTPHSRMRRAIATALTESKRSAPHFYLRGVARVDSLLRLREEVNDGASVRISVTDLIVKAAAQAHLQVPGMNVIWTAEAVRSFSAVDICVAVATEHGLMTPVIRGVDKLSVSALARTTAELAQRARAATLYQHDLEGGTLTVTNLGMYGVSEFAAILKPPQAAILAVGAIQQEPIVLAGALAVASVLRLTLSVDHRPVDGVIAAQWMAAFIALLEAPVRILA